MAGFDFDFVYDPTLEPFVEAGMSAAKMRARTMKLRWRVHRLAGNVIRARIDGNGRRMDLLALVLERDLPLVCEGVAGTGIPPMRRRALGVRLADLYVRGRDMTTPAQPLPMATLAHERNRSSVPARAIGPLTPTSQPRTPNG